jgi:hypothetical protein
MQMHMHDFLSLSLSFFCFFGQDDNTEEQGS